MSYSLSLFAGAGWQFFDNNGEILSGGKLYTFAAGSTTPLVTYANSTGTTFNTNPIELNSAGRVPYEIWVDGASIAKFELRTSTGVLIGTWDNIPSLISSLNLTGTNNGVVYFNSVGSFSSGTNLTFDGTNLVVAGAAAVGSNLNVAGPTSLGGAVSTSSSLTVAGTATVSGNTSLNGNASVGGTTTLNGTLSVGGNVINTLNVTGTLTTSGVTTLATNSTLATSPSTSDNSTKIATTAYVTNKTLGVGQTWTTTFTPARADNTVYTNDTGKPIMVSVTYTFGAGMVELWIDTAAAPLNCNVCISRQSGSATNTQYQSLVSVMGIIPPGRAYKTTSDSDHTINLWAELR